MPYRRYRFSLLFFAYLLAWSTASAEEQVFRIPEADPRALFEPLCLSSSNTDDIFVAELVTDGDYEFTPALFNQKIFPAGPCFSYGILTVDLKLGEVRGRVRIEGNGARVRGLNLLVAEGGSLEVTDVNFAMQNSLAPALVNEGTVVVQRAGFFSAEYVPAVESRALVLFNSGTMTLRSVAIFNNFRQQQRGCAAPFSTVFNSGQLELVHTTMARNYPGSCDAVNILNEGEVSIRNSILLTEGLGFSCAGEGAIRSGGYNVQNFHPCTGTLAATDVNPRSRLDLRPRSFARHRQSLGFDDASPARDLIPVESCHGLDQFGSPRGPEACDPGAVEQGAPVAATPRSVTGLWFQVDRDGHYLQVQFFQPDEVLLTWQTFDPDGNSLWLYGTGTAVGNTIELAMFKNTGLAFRDGVITGTVNAEPVGRALFETQACDAATLRFELDDLGQGRMRFQKLVGAEGLACEIR